MDTRTAMLKTLKKESKLERRKFYTHWKVLAIFMLVVVLLTCLTGAAAEFQHQEPVCRILDLICDWKAQAEDALDMTLDLSGIKTLFEDDRFALVCQIIAGTGTVLFVIFAALWRQGKRKWKYSGAYLDYQTMYVTLKAEQQAAREK